jgi:predicted nucleic acid-binding protein
MAGKLLYLDSSAIVKLVVPEAETKALRELLKSWPERVSSVVARIEVERVARRIGGGAVRRARTVLSRIALVDLDEDVVQTAAALVPPELRTLDAIHLATAISLGVELGALCAYDVRLGGAAISTAIDVLAPA